MLLYFDDERMAAGRTARALGSKAAVVHRHRFPDGEIKLTLPRRLPRRVVLFRSLAQPNEKLVELLLTAQGARELGATHLTLVAPYLAYMRQDCAFAPGEAVSQRHIGTLLASLFDAVVTVDPHLHRTADLADVLPGCEAVTLTAAALAGRQAARRVPGALLVGPDEESAQWVKAAAAAARTDWVVCRKVRRGDRSVRIVLPDYAVARRCAVLVDDVASTGRTLAVATRELLAAGASSVDVIVTHAIFTGRAIDDLRAAGVRHVWSTDSIQHPTNAIRLAPLLARGLGRRR